MGAAGLCYAGNRLGGGQAEHKDRHWDPYHSFKRCQPGSPESYQAASVSCQRDGQKNVSPSCSCLPGTLGNMARLD